MKKITAPFSRRWKTAAYVSVMVTFCNSLVVKTGRRKHLFRVVLWACSITFRKAFGRGFKFMKLKCGEKLTQAAKYADIKMLQTHAQLNTSDLFV